MKILLVDDDKCSNDSLRDFISDNLGFEVCCCENGAEALAEFEKNSYQLIISDIRMPRMTGIELLKAIRNLESGKKTNLIFITGHGDIETAVQAMRMGAYDFLQKPVNISELALLIERSMELQTLQIEHAELKHNFEGKVEEATRQTEEKYKSIQKAYAKIIGMGKIGLFSQKMKDLSQMALNFHKDKSAPVVIEGETGTGKEIFARMVHYGESGETSPFISINCSAISPNLFESELFGYDKGSFTGADSRGKIGKLELAQGGTLFLDEIGDMPLDMQPKLLRVLQEKEYYRVGGLKKIKLNCRVVCATNMDLAALIDEGVFRRDLYYRLAVGKIEIPPLRERVEEIKPLSQLFLKKYVKEKKRSFTHFSDDAIEILESAKWPGNVRELENAIERIVLLYDDLEVLPKHISFLDGKAESKNQSSSTNVFDINGFELPGVSLDIKHLEKEVLRKAVLKYKGNKTHAAEYLCLSRSALRSRLKSFNLS